MPNFNYNRTVDLISYLPEILRDIREYKEIAKAEEPVIKALWEACENCMDDQFIETATLNGVQRREKLLGIVPQATDTLADRKFRLLAQYNESIPYTRKNLEVLLKALCGDKKYILEFDAGTFFVNIKLVLAARKHREIISQTMERILPYNMQFNVELLYMTWQTHSGKTWGAVKARTWQQIKEEV